MKNNSKSSVPYLTLAPPPSLLIKLGSIIVHYQELNSPSGHAFDKTTIDSLLEDVEVKNWMIEMDRLALLPKKR